MSTHAISPGSNAAQLAQVQAQQSIKSSHQGTVAPQPAPAPAPPHDAGGDHDGSGGPGQHIINIRV